MAFVSAIVSAVTAIGSFLASGTIGALLVRTAITALVSYSLQRSISKKQTQTGIDTGVRQMLQAATNHKIPVLYGTAFIGGAITDGQLSTDNKTMWLCLTISERTGPRFSDGAASDYKLLEVYRNSDRLYFANDGVTVIKSVDADGNEDTSMNGLIKIYFYAGSSVSTDERSVDLISIPAGNNSAYSAQNAYDLMPLWDSSDTMSDLVFAVIRVDYNRDKNMTSIGDFQFKVQNNMSSGGDVLFDYATNTRYGAGIRMAEINTGESRATTLGRVTALNTYKWIDLS